VNLRTMGNFDIARRKLWLSMAGGLMITVAAPAANSSLLSENYSFDPFSQNWNDAWRRKIGDYEIRLLEGERPDVQNMRAFFSKAEFAGFKLITAKGPAERIVKEIKSEADKQSLLRTFGEKESMKSLELFTAAVGNLPGMETVAWTVWFSSLFGETRAVKAVSKTRTTFSAIAAVGGRIVYQEALLQASDGRWLLYRSLYYRVTVGQEARILPLNYNRILVEIEP
jgi:hypothetical protein